ncbi:MAG: 30S ribosomal protein S20 [Candidatus Zambryskibacteria bacterium RIFCSPHIGHO2_01_FULL_43_25]|uniref:Small ribosomal subunit protein bS20 n=1 Tax=Candidatus Zambryskibacteria bacterium RIFCSPLOWO2_01_FULL_45_21 TaxID=1802761 RepID=A0A1G2U486_9BACT|nr:MAG: 30S ribosomal protein S20 [Candidatus Zambryskibacteria bacterium RIFCSPHIGHO2_01_FULL_43_25]OHB00732.1 MAG: 30S ribosomal protein S20 [Candidatus Zambryskibacteria bacterium RIFCSPHIGHO2_12_FULL_44_12b]OHB04328.1 MAG: 30S ribosomal protein S20 [Candidatus Zambryskibacteria bacterium RIFCSPLOWO2_01_FULL_45_21]
MPITKSAKKALRNSARKQEFNLRHKRDMLWAEKKLRKLIADKKTKEAQEFFQKVQKIIDKAAKRGVIKDNTASRKKSRLSAVIRKAS